jgi:hypothetical protein
MYVNHKGDKQKSHAAPEHHNFTCMHTYSTKVHRAFYILVLACVRSLYLGIVRLSELIWVIRVLNRVFISNVGQYNEDSF